MGHAKLILRTVGKAYDGVQGFICLAQVTAAQMSTIGFVGGSAQLGNRLIHKFVNICGALNGGFVITASMAMHLVGQSLRHIGPILVS